MPASDATPPRLIRSRAATSNRSNCRSVGGCQGFLERRAVIRAAGLLVDVDVYEVMAEAGGPGGEIVHLVIGGLCVVRFRDSRIDRSLHSSFSLLWCAKTARF